MLCPRGSLHHRATSEVSQETQQSVRRNSRRKPHPRQYASGYQECQTSRAARAAPPNGGIFPLAQLVSKRIQCRKDAAQQPHYVSAACRRAARRRGFVGGRVSQFSESNIRRIRWCRYLLRYLRLSDFRHHPERPAAGVLYLRRFLLPPYETHFSGIDCGARRHSWAWLPVSLSKRVPQSGQAFAWRGAVPGQHYTVARHRAFRHGGRAQAVVAPLVAGGGRAILSALAAVPVRLLQAALEHAPDHCADLPCVLRIQCLGLRRQTDRQLLPSARPVLGTDGWQSASAASRRWRGVRGAWLGDAGNS